MRLDISLVDDRLTVAAILVKNGYTVRQGKEKKPNKTTWVHFIEATKDGADE